MVRILLTGATGTLGSMLFARLLGRGHELVCLVRGESADVALERLSRIHAGERIRAVRGDIDMPDCGLSAVERERISKIDIVVHCAASIAFLDEKGARETNIFGLRRVLKLAKDLRATEFHHISTAYVAGDAMAFSEDDLDVGQNFRNPYEQSKFVGETLVREWACDNSMRAVIYRPSILVGAEDGSIQSFDAYYSYLKPFALTAKSMCSRGARNAHGVSVASNGDVYLPLILYLRRSATLNIVPVDWAADRIVDLMSLSDADGAYHIVHPRPPRVGSLFEASFDALGIKGLHIVESADEKQRMVSDMPAVLARVQRRIDRLLGPYVPYTLGEARFSDARLRGALKDSYVPPKDIDETYVATLLQFAEKAGWGR